MRGDTGMGNGEAAAPAMTNEEDMTYHSQKLQNRLLYGALLEIDARAVDDLLDNGVVDGAYQVVRHDGVGVGVAAVGLVESRGRRVNGLALYLAYAVCDSSVTCPVLTAIVASAGCGSLR